MAGQYDIGVSASTSSGAQSGFATTGDFNVTMGGKAFGGLLPSLTPDKAWIAWAVVGVGVVLGLALFFKFKSGR